MPQAMHRYTLFHNFEISLSLGNYLIQQSSSTPFCALCHSSGIRFWFSVGVEETSYSMEKCVLQVIDFTEANVIQIAVAVVYAPR